MNWKNIATVYRKELTDTLRDRRALMSMIIIPTIVMPGLMFGVGKIAATVVSRARAEVSAVMVLGGTDSPGVLRQLRQDRKLRLVAAGADWRDQISEKKIRAAVQIPAGFEAGLAGGAADPVRIYHYEGELKSGLAAGELEDFFRDLRDRTVATQLAERRLPATLVKPFSVERENVAPPEKVGGNLLGGIVPYLIIILCFTGAMYPAMDLTAGEKERGTMETLLCSPVARVDLVLGKFLMVLTGSLSAMCFMLLSMGTTALIAGTLLAGVDRTAALSSSAAAAKDSAAVIPMIDPLGLLGVLAMVVPVAVF
ncbi:MAG: ABC transporter permease subunit, partial [Opitutales bacterium]